MYLSCAGFSFIPHLCPICPAQGQLQKTAPATCTPLIAAELLGPVLGVQVTCRLYDPAAWPVQIICDFVVPFD
jgi:hypothetical protein